jgi:hypothetical protein
MGSSDHERNLAIRVEARQSGGVRGYASAHLLGHRAENLHRLNAPRHECGESAQGGLFGGEPAILRVQLILIDRQVRLKPCAEFAVVRGSCLRVGIDSATC